MSHMGLWSVQKSGTLSDLEWPSGHRVTLFHTTAAFGASCDKFTEATPILSVKKCRPRSLVFGLWYSKVKASVPRTWKWEVSRI